ncbi:MAG: biofilm-associated protein [Nitrosopumilaceae archaeon]
MNSSFTRGVFLWLLLVVSMFTVFSLNEIVAQENAVSAKSTGFEETTIIEFENNGNSDIETFRMWLGADNSFKSFKTERGWTGEKTPQGVIIFTATDPIKPGQSVKFGVKTDKTQPGINWKAVDKNSNELQIGKTLVTESPSKPIIKNGKPTSSGDAGILADSKFRLIPDKPNVGGTIRVTGDEFNSNQEFDLYFNKQLLESFETDENGHFMLTTKIPEGKADRVDFVVKDNQGNEKTLSIRLGEGIARVAEEDVSLTITGLPLTINPGDVMLISGTASPGGTITAEITDPDGNTITSEAASVSQQGEWSFETIVLLDTPLGKYSAEISDGKDTILKSWTVESSKTIHITPAKIKFDPGEALVFNGTAIPNQQIEIILKDPTGSEIYSDFIQPKGDGFFEFEFLTKLSSLEGTYALIAFQGEKSEIILVGLGELPEVQLVAQMDKTNYKAGDKAIISFIGPASSTISLLIIDPSDQATFTDTIIVGPDGKKEYELDLTGYGSGVYTAVVSRGNAQAEELFSVGLQTGSGQIEISTTKDSYKPGDPILLLGKSGANILVKLTLYDPDGNEIKSKEIFTDKDGVLSEGTFRIPSEAKIGVWKMKAVSGPNFVETEFSVTPSEEQGMSIIVTDISKGVYGNLVTINGFGAEPSRTIVIVVTSSEGEEIDELTVFATGVGDFSVIWKVPDETSPGIYTIEASDSISSAETTVDLE